MVGGIGFIRGSAGRRACRVVAWKAATLMGPCRAFRTKRFDAGVCLDSRNRDGLVEGALIAGKGTMEALLDSSRLDGADKQTCRSSDGRTIDAIVVVKLLFKLLVIKL